MNQVCMAVIDYQGKCEANQVRRGFNKNIVNN